MSSYLGTSYLDEDESYGDAGNATMALVPAGGESLGDEAASDVIVLPGGIVLPRKTAYLLLAAAVVMAIVVYLKKNKKAE